MENYSLSMHGTIIDFTDPTHVQQVNKQNVFPDKKKQHKNSETFNKYM